MKNATFGTGARLAVAALAATMTLAGSAAIGQQNVQQPAAVSWKIIHAGRALLVPGQAPRQNVSIVVRGDTIERVADGFLEPAALGAAGAQARVVDLRQSFVLPG